MALSKLIVSTSLSIEVENGVDASGDPKYTKKTFSDVKSDAALENIYDVAQAIKNVLNASTGETYINTTHSIVNGQ